MSTNGNTRSEKYSEQPHRLTALLVTFNPDPPELADTLAKAVAQVENVVVVDNSPGMDEQATVRRCVEEVAGTHPPESGNGHIVLDTQGKNSGLPKAYNAGLLRAKSLGTDLVLLLDQDSSLDASAVSELRRVYSALGSSLRIGAVCCENIELVHISLPIDVVLEKLKRSRRLGKDIGLIDSPAREQNLFTNSGAMIPLSTALEVGGFDESLFLDAVDYEYSLRLAANGYKIFVAEAARVFHKQGQTYLRRFLWWQLQLRTYPPMRSYYIVRDTLRLGKKWWRRYPRTVVGIIGTMALSSLGAVLLLPDRGERIRKLLLALKDWDPSRQSSLPAG